MISLYRSVNKFIKNKLPKHRTYTYVALGDSVAEGIGATILDRSYTSIIYTYLKRSKKRVEYHNFSKQYAPVAWVREEQIEKAISLQPDLITLSVGANDIRVRNMPWKFKDDLREVIQKLKDQTNATIIINSIPDFSHLSVIPFLIKPITRLWISRYNNAIEQVARETGILYVDLFHTTGVFAKTFPEITGDDGFHPSDFGHALWAQSILHLLSRN